MKVADIKFAVLCLFNRRRRIATPTNNVCRVEKYYDPSADCYIHVIYRVTSHLECVRV